MRSEVLACVAATQVSPAPSPSATARPARTTFCSSRAEVNLHLELAPGPAADHGREALGDLARPVAHALGLVDDLLRVEAPGQPPA